jgi:hypothetical protein
MSTATQQLSKHISVATNAQTIEELLEVLSYMWSVLKLYKEGQQNQDTKYLVWRRGRIPPL